MLEAASCFVAFSAGNGDWLVTIPKAAIALTVACEVDPAYERGFLLFEKDRLLLGAVLRRRGRRHFARATAALLQNALLVTACFRRLGVGEPRWVPDQSGEKSNQTKRP